MALRPFSVVPSNTREWAEWCRKQFIQPDPGSVNTSQIADGAVTNAKLRSSDALSVIGRAVNSNGTPDDIVAANDGDVLRRSGATIGFGSIAAASLSGFTEDVQDVTAALITNGTGLSWTYNDALATLTGNVSLAPFTTTNLAEGSGLYFNDERAQDAVGAALANSSTVTLTYVDATPSITAAVVADSISDTLIRNSVALSVIGRSANTTGDPADIAAANDGEVLRRSGTALGFGTVATAGIADDAVTNAKLANMAQSTIKGRAAGAGTGDPTDLSVAQVLAILGLTGLIPVPGTYTPTLTNVTNLDSSTAYSTQYVQIGTVVIVSGRVDVDVTTTALSTELGISLPVASNLANLNELGGVAFANNSAGMGASILGNAANDRASMVWVSSSTAGQAMSFIFMYRVI